MRYHNALPRFLLTLSFIVQLTIAICAVAFCLIVFMLLPARIQNPCLFAIPVALIAWMFGRGGLFLALFVIIVALWLYYSGMTNTLLWSMDRIIFLSIVVAVILFIGLFISSQRELFDIAADGMVNYANAYEQQSKLHQTKDQFLQNVNHELRTPLTAIYGYLELLLQHNEQLDAIMRATFLEHAMQSCDELQMLVNNVLDSMNDSKGKREQVYVEELAVFDIVHEVLERFDPKTLQAHTVYLRIPNYVVVRANSQYTRQVLRNLLSNAFKYAYVNTPIVISAALYRDTVHPYHPSPEICISVKDVGPGIPPEEIPLLFNQFVRLPRETASNVRGSGLGLYLSKQFVEMMGGKIWIESEGIAGKGSCFSFTLPCVPRPSIKVQTPIYEIYHPTVPVDK